MNEKFVLHRKRREYKQNVKFPKISVSREVFFTLQDWADETGSTLSEIAKQAIEYCKKNLIFED